MSVFTLYVAFVGREMSRLFFVPTNIDKRILMV